MNGFLTIIEKYEVLSLGLLHHNEYLIKDIIPWKTIMYVSRYLFRHILQLRAGNRKTPPKPMALITDWTKEIVPFKEAKDLKILIPAYVKTCATLPTIYLVYGFSKEMDLAVITGIENKYLVKVYEKPSLVQLSFSLHSAAYVGDHSSAALREQVRLQSPEKNLITGPFLGFFFLEEEVAPVNLFSLPQVKHLAMATKAYHFLKRLEQAKLDPKKKEFAKNANLDKAIYYTEEGGTEIVL